MTFGEYYTSLDRTYGRIEPSDVQKDSLIQVETSGLGPQDIGTTTHPMQNTVQSFGAKIREGAGKIEIGFLGQGKTNSQQPGPEAFGRLERQDIREMAEMNKIETSVHAAWHNGSLAGFTREGFNEQARQQALTEVEKAIHFAADTTKGGAIVFHTGEWQRPINELKDNLFRGFPNEDTKSPILVVDRVTGEMVALRKDQSVFEPKFKTIADYEVDNNVKLVGTEDDFHQIRNANDWVDIKGNAIKRKCMISDKSEETDRLFERLPVWNKEQTRFEAEEKTFQKFEIEAKELGIAPEVLFVKTQYANSVLQNKGMSLYHAHRYDDIKKSRDEALKALEFYKDVEGKVPPAEQWKMMRKVYPTYVYENDLVSPENKLPSEVLQHRVKELTDEMRHIHESSASADAQAKQAFEKMNRVRTVQDFGLQKTAETIGTLGVKAMKYTQSKKLPNPLFVSPENWDAREYGSHPDEIRKIVTESRKNMQNQLITEGYSADQAKDMAKQHIKATLDIGHFNTWRHKFIARDGETPEKRDERFNRWMLDQTEKLAKDGLLGHIHLSDNFGYDDEHLTPGEGNVPLKEFVKRMEAAGMKDLIVEPGSFNGQRTLSETLSNLGSPVYSFGRTPTMRGFHEQHFGYHNPSVYIVGAYAPSNEWHLWSEVPFE
ncbi:MAG: TIM barrel protein [archaeon]